MHITDSRKWEGGALDSWGDIDEITDWTLKHNCVFIAAVLSTKLMEFSAEKYLVNQNYTVYSNYDLALEECIERLAQAQKSL